ncbi:MAG: thioredoxin-disulfide reductase [Chloroflexi bacterium]|nr:thioredoxin-disulfide reductase [Chloroflexota bacterium]
MTDDKKYDAVIIGGGPAGLTAAIYTVRGEYSTLLLERAFTGGLMAQASWIENFPGFEDGISGFELGEKMLAQATKLGAIVKTGTVIALEDYGLEKKLTLENGEIITAKAVIIAGGNERRKLGVPGEEKYLGRGVSYCATCDGAFYKDRVVAVVGGGNSAFSEALHLTSTAKKVYLIHRRLVFKSQPSLQERVKNNPKIEIIYESQIKEMRGNIMLEELLLENNSGQQSVLKVDGVFISVGLVPQTDYLKDLLHINQNGAIVTDINMQTNVPGILAAGDIREGAIQQAVSAAGDGATAAFYAQKYLGSICKIC